MPAEVAKLTLNGERDGPEMEVYQQSMWMYDVEIAYNSYNASHGGYFTGGRGYPQGMQAGLLWRLPLQLVGELLRLAYRCS